MYSTYYIIYDNNLSFCDNLLESNVFNYHIKCIISEINLE